MSINSRFELLIDTLFNGKQSAFASAIGVTPSVINNIVGKRQGKPSFELMEKISAIEGINIDWLISGRGEMLISEITTTSHKYLEKKSPRSTAPNIIGTMGPFLTNEPEPAITKSTPGAIPLVSEKAVGGLINDENLNIQEDDIKGYYVIPKFRYNGVNFLIEVIGDSMEPRIFPGDIIGCSIIYDPRYIQWGKIYLLATRQDGLIVKRIRKSSQPGCLSAVSENPSYEPFDIPQEEIFGMARVVGVVHLE